jgi:hypothetical protein
MWNLHSSGLGQGLVITSYKDSNEPSGSVEGGDLSRWMTVGLLRSLLHEVSTITIYSETPT